MLHTPIFTYLPAILERLHVPAGALQELILWTMIFVAPILSYRLIEKPALSLKRFLDYTPASQPPRDPERRVADARNTDDGASVTTRDR
jgi:peptidoglycan/LPS O-acetylase OafA/YrhL